jgi:hypothetical protein
MRDRSSLRREEHPRTTNEVSNIQHLQMILSDLEAPEAVELFLHDPLAAFLYEKWYCVYCTQPEQNPCYISMHNVKFFMAEASQHRNEVDLKWDELFVDSNNWATTSTFPARATVNGYNAAAMRPVLTATGGLP